ncbi:flavoprotein [Xylariomycetidae sp. FL2044]|nr:flavoprotein [Xylariomycetidae sp. FL2044]
MLQAISPNHDTHHLRTRQHSLASLTASHTDGKAHLLLAASGSVATIKLPQILSALSARHGHSHGHDDEGRHGHRGLSIRVLLTPSSARFLAGQSAEQPPATSLLDHPCVDAVYADADEWREPWRRGDAILHIELRRWADLLVVAPLSANTMAKMVGGFADGLLTSVVRAWDAWGELDSDVAAARSAIVDGGEDVAAAAAVGEGDGSEDGDRKRRTRTKTMKKKKKRIIVAPAMNTAMWRHPVTAKHLRVLEEEWGVNKNKNKDSGSSSSAPAAPPSHETGEDSTTTTAPHKSGKDNAYDDDKDDEENNDGWFEVLRPQKKMLACGDVGDGAMVEWQDIVAVIEDRLGLNGSD